MNNATKGDAPALKTRRAMREHNKNNYHHQASGGSLLQPTRIEDELGLSRCDFSPQGIWFSFPGSAPFALFLPMPTRPGRRFYQPLLGVITALLPNMKGFRGSH